MFKAVWFFNQNQMQGKENQKRVITFDIILTL